ncbi:MAG TPA: NAD(P)-dependent alcohol dehydrogenase [Devosia sp.]|jgi:NADPH:quinone reductase-like Zn-dependent oxidoreductase|nr:NAD(P)-dependent alcohol dehydrogenase [Devosia sp.]
MNEIATIATAEPTMLAAIQTRYGGPDVVEVRQVPRPVAGPGQMLIRVHAVTLTLADCAFRKAQPFIVRFFAGWLAPKQGILGDSISGVVEAVGPGVTRFAPGDAVFGTTNTGTGGTAEYMVAAEDAAIFHRPRGLDDAGAAGLTYSFLTAMPFIRDEGRVKPDDRVLINGASGSVGIVAVQLAKHFGAHVTGVCSSRNVELVRSLGADAVIDYTTANFTAAREGYDVILDAVGKSSFSQCRKALKPDGIYLTTVPSLGIVYHMLTRRNEPQRARLATTGLRPLDAKKVDLIAMRELVEAGAIRAVTDRRFPLRDVQDAHRYVETERKAGDVVVEMPAALSPQIAG